MADGRLERLVPYFKGFLGMSAAAFLWAFLYCGWVLYQDHLAVQAIVQMINKQAQQQQAAPRPPEPAK